jgi:hypothetical protein
MFAINVSRGAEAPMNQYRPGIDNFRFFYLPLPAPYELPSVHTTGITIDEKIALLEVFRNLAPGFVDGFRILRENRPARYASELHLARPLIHEGKFFLLVLRILAEYRGGATDPEILVQGTQERSVRVLTDRIYYRARIVPCLDVKESGEWIDDFSPDRLPELTGYFTEAREVEQRPGRHTFAVFLETDFGAFNARVSHLFGNWTYENVFFPFIGDDYVTLSLNVPLPHPYYINTALPRFARAFATIRSGGAPDPVDIPFWRDYYAGFELERSYSRGGNPHWRFTRLPWD